MGVDANLSPRLIAWVAMVATVAIRRQTGVMFGQRESFVKDKSLLSQLERLLRFDVDPELRERVKISEVFTRPLHGHRAALYASAKSAG